MLGVQVKKKECKTGFPCGNSCQQKGKTCHPKLSGFAQQAQSWLKENSQGSFQLTQKDKAIVRQVKENFSDTIASLMTGLTGKDTMSSRQRDRINTRRIEKTLGVTTEEASKISNVLYLWTESGYEDIRYYQRTGKVNSGYDLLNSKDPEDRELYDAYKKQTEQDIATLNRFIDASPKHKGMAARGIKLLPEEIEGFLSSFSEPTELDALSSFTSDPKIASYFAHNDADATGRIPVIITVPNSKSGVDISGYSRHRSEKEVLFPKGVKFKASKPPTLVQYTDGTYRINLELMEVS